MASVIEIQPRHSRVRVLAIPRRALLAALLIEAALIGGILLPLRLDQHPPSLAINLAVRLGRDSRGLLLYLLLVAMLTGGYLLALSAVARAGRRALVPVVGASAVFTLTVLAAHPAYSSDVFHYVATARVSFTYGENPHTVPPEAFPDDPAMIRSGWKWLASPYGPAWSWLSAVPWAVSDGAEDATRAVLAFKLLTGLCVIGATTGIALAAERLRPGSGGVAALLFGWNPVVLIHLAADGHNDATMLLVLAWGAVALTRGRLGLSLALFGIGVLVKPAAIFAPAILAGVLLRERRWGALAMGAGVATGAAIMLWWPFWDGPRTLAAMVDEGRYFTGTPASLVQRLLERQIGGDPARLVVGGVARVVLVVVTLIAIIRTSARPGTILFAIGEVYVIAVVILGTWYQPWYATWPLLFLGIAWITQPRAFPLILGITIGALLVPVAVNFVTAFSGRPAGNWAIDLLATGLVVVPIVFLFNRVSPVEWLRGPSDEALVSSAGVHPPRTDTA